MLTHNSILFQWKDPVDADWMFTRIIKKVNNKPTSPYDGDLLYVESYIKDQYSMASGIWLRDVGVTTTDKYYYGFYPADTKGTYNTTSQNIVGPIQIVHYPSVTNET